MGDWFQTTIGEQATLQRGFDITRDTQRPGSVPVVSSGGISSFHDTAMVRGPGVVLGRKGVVGSVFFVEPDFWPHDTSLWVKDFHGNDRRFVYYFFKSRAAELAGLDVGSANPTLNRNHVHPTPIFWPSSIVEQGAISAVLGALDDKIELNRRMHETLEAMVQAIFRDWFVDFGPLSRKLAGVTDPVKVIGDLTHDLDRAARLVRLFPEEFEGALPKGWTLKTVGSIARRVATGPFGSRIKKDNFVLAGVPVIRGVNLAQGFVDDEFVFLTEGKARELKNSKAQREDIVFTHRGTLGQLGRIHPLSNYDTYIASQSQIVLSVDHSKTSPLFMYWFLRSDEGLSAWLSNAGGAGVPSIARPTDSLKRIEFPDPGLELAYEFDRLARTLEARGVALQKEITSLAEARDYLLPRLMSGEVRVGDVAQEIAA